MIIDFEEGCVEFNGRPICERYKTDSCFKINSDQVIAFMCYDGEGGKNSDIIIYLRDDNRLSVHGHEGLGKIHEDTLRECLDAPVDVSCRSREAKQSESIPCLYY